MANIDGFYSLDTKARKDPLGHSYLNGLLNNQDLLTNMFGREHYVSDDVGTAGEHNVREIPRSAAVLTATGGPPATGYSINCPDGYLTVSSTPEAGDLRLALAAGQGTAGRMAVQLQSYSTSGATLLACPMWAHIASATDIRVYTCQITDIGGGGGVTELWAPARMDFGMLVYSEPTQDGEMANDLADAAYRGIGLRATSIWNKLVQRDGDLRALIDVAHDPDTGAHDDFRIPRAVYKLSWNGTTYDIVYSDISHADFTLNTATRTAAGKINLTFNTDIFANYTTVAPFVTCDYPRSDGGTPDMLFDSICPNDLMALEQMTVYLFQHKDWSGSTVWGFADSDFWLTIHAET